MNNAPELRFKSFTTPWVNTRLGDIAFFKSGNTPSKNNSSFWGGDYPWISASSMHSHSFGSSEYTLTEGGLKAAKVAKNGTLLLLVRGSMLFNKIPVGIATRKVAFNQDVKAINTSEVTSSNFLLLWFLAQENRLLNMVTGTGIGAGKLDTDELKGLPFVYPEDRKEQQKIADFLTSVDTKISQLTEKHRLLKEYKKGVMQQVFSQQIRFKDEDGKAFPEWKEFLFSDIAQFSKGKGISKSDIVENGKTPCIRYGELYTIYGEVINSISSYTNVETNSLILSEINDVILPCSGETQIDIATASCVMLPNVAYSGDLTIVKSKINGIFLSYFLNSAKKTTIAALSQGSSVIHLYASHLKTMKLTVPTSKEEQQKIAQFLQSIDQKIDAVTKQIDQTKQFKKGLLQQMFV
ncbi:restriction endonuclease subunit S [Vibrio sp. S12_S33]|uniref:restriction endonuclease subunit S n=1 Tax=Vibrio sp. S12_S33 TaxID=2720223 RepID=UPI0017842591|nr:restriction endonuclease subunit S [Vibrio sp. S12_S33]MBD1564557.1 hypothetical protein [Vibrio sp. S12_S33]